MQYRLKRQITILVVLAFFVAIVFLLPFLLKKDAPSCFDNIQNQDEEGVDCGGSLCAPCISQYFEDIEVLLVGVVEFDGKYDAFARIKNPNSQFGTDNLLYSFKFYDADDNFISEVSSKTYMLAGQTRYVVYPAIFLEKRPAYAKFIVNSVDFKEQIRTNIKLPIFSKRFETIKGLGREITSQASGIVENQTNYSFLEVDVIAVLLNENGDYIAVNKTKINNLRAGERRKVIVPWFSEIKNGPVAKVIIEASANAIDDSNILK